MSEVSTITYSTQVPFTTITPGNFTLAHGLGQMPASVIIQMTDGGIVWFQNPRYDNTNLYLVASDEGLTGYALVYSSIYANAMF